MKTKYKTYQNLWDAAKAVLRGKFIAVNVYLIKKKELKSIVLSPTLRN